MASDETLVLKTGEKRIGTGLAGPGRPKGRKSDALLAAEEFAREVLYSQEYRDSIWRRIKADTLPPAVETMLHYYAAGKPTDRVEHSGLDGEPLEVITRIVRVTVTPGELAAESRPTTVTH